MLLSGIQRTRLGTVIMMCQGVVTVPLPIEERVRVSERISPPPQRLCNVLVPNGTSLPPELFGASTWGVFDKASVASRWAEVS